MSADALDGLSERIPAAMPVLHSSVSCAAHSLQTDCSATCWPDADVSRHCQQTVIYATGGILTAQLRRICWSNTSPELLMRPCCCFSIVCWLHRINMYDVHQPDQLNDRLHNNNNNDNSSQLHLLLFFVRAWQPVT
jgi:hypothetical protein